MIKFCFSGDFLKYLYRCQGHHHLPWRNSSILLREGCHSSVDSWQSIASIFHVSACRSVFPRYGPYIAQPHSPPDYYHMIGRYVGKYIATAGTFPLPSTPSKKSLPLFTSPFICSRAPLWDITWESYNKDLSILLAPDLKFLETTPQQKSIEFITSKSEWPRVSACKDNLHT